MSSSVSSDSSSFLRRSPARKKTRVNSRSPSPADDNPHSPSRTAYPASHRDHLSLFAGNDDKFNSHSEDNQDLAPDTLRHSGLWSLGIGHTGNPSDHKHSAHRLQSVRPDSVVGWSILLNRTLLELQSELEHWSACLEPDIVLMLLVHHGGITAHIVRLFSFVTLTQVNFFPASLLRHRVRIRSRSYDSVFPRHHSHFLSRSREKKKSHKKRIFSSTSSPSSHRFPSLLLEKEKGNGTCLKKKHISLRSFNMTSM